MNAYPSHQPFPRSRAVSIEASSSPASPGLAGLRTYQLPPYHEAERTMRSYLAQYERMSSGAALGIRGAFGSGKTHLIYFLMETAQAFHGDSAPRDNPVQVYTKAKSGDFFEIYRELVNGLGGQQLAQGHAKVLSAAGRRLAKGNELFEANVPNMEMPTAFEQLRDKPEMVLSLIRDALLSESAIVETAAAELRGPDSRFTDFFSAFTFLNDQKLRKTAFSWFQGATVDPDSLKRLGVSGPVTAADASRGLQFISMMYAFARTPLIIYIDQIERLILDDVDRREANRGYLHSLVEALVTNRNMLVVAGVSQAWDQLKPDFLQRLTLPPLIMPSLDVKQAQAIIAVWLAEDPETYDVSQIFPFTRDGIGEIVKLSRGNIRSIISLCYNCFELARPEKAKVTRSIVRKAAESLEKLYSRATVLEEIETYLRAAKCPYEKRVTLVQDSQDIVVPDSSAPRAVINVMEPVFLEDEARDAHAHAAAADKLRNEFPDIEYVLVDVGYRSGEVEEILRPPLIDFYVRYDPEGFRGEIKGIIETIQHPINNRDSEQKALEMGGVNESIRQLQDLVITRAEQQAKVTEQIADILKSIGAPVVNVHSNIERDPYSRLWWAKPGLLAAFGVLMLFMLLASFGIAWFEKQNRQSAVARSLEFVDRGISDSVRMARDETYNFLKKSSRSDFQYERGESLFSLLLSSSASSSAQVLLNYYGAVAVCIRGELCDRSTICEAVVPQIASLQSTIARAADVSSPIVGSPAADKGRWTEADRLLGACQS